MSVAVVPAQSSNLSARMNPVILKIFYSWCVDPESVAQP